MRIIRLANLKRKTYLVKNRNSLGVACTDFDSDGDMDLHFANDFGAFTGPNELYENNFPEFFFFRHR